MEATAKSTKNATVLLIAMYAFTLNTSEPGCAQEGSNTDKTTFAVIEAISRMRTNELTSACNP